MTRVALSTYQITVIQYRNVVSLLHSFKKCYLLHMSTFGTIFFRQHGYMIIPNDRNGLANIRSGWLLH
jgi:hypothetical protein